jgi:signal transduction histidine kinase
MVNLKNINRILKRDTFLMQFIPAAIVFLALLAFALGSWQNAVRSRDAQYSKAVEQRVAAAEDRLEERMKTSGTLLRAGNGLLYGSEYVSRDEWQLFYEQLTGSEQYIGAGIVGYAPIVNAAERIRFETIMGVEGLGSNIITTGNPDVMAPLLYATIFDEAEQVAYGHDMYADAEFRATMHEARDSGDIGMTPLVTKNDKNGSEVALFMPIYAYGLPVATVAERQTALVGFVYETLHINQLFSSLADERSNSFGFVVSELGADRTNQLYRSANMRYFSSNERPVEQKIFNGFGRTWQLQFYAADTLVAANERTRPIDVLAIGIGLAVIASLLVYMLVKYRTRIFAMAEEQKLQKAKDELLSLASHQLRTPATGVKQYVGMVLDGFGGPVPKEQVKLLEQAYKSNERQLQIINEFLYVAKLGSGSLTTTKHKFDMAPLVRDVVEEMSIEIQERSHKVRIKIPKTMPIRADEHSVRMIIENLLSNAVKYTQPGGRIEVEMYQGNREVLVKVRDNGVGISRKDQKLLFKQFSRIPNELTNEVSGSGIGLYLAQQLAVRNGGKIVVESEPSRGSTFTLSLPNWRVKKITMRGRSA